MVRTKWYGQNGMDKMIYGQNVIGQNVIGQNGTNKTVPIKSSINLNSTDNMIFSSIQRPL